MRSAPGRIISILLVLVMTAALAAVPAAAEGGAVTLSCASFEIKDGGAKGIVEIINGSDAALNGTVFVALYADERFVGSVKLGEISVEPEACLRRAVAIAAPGVDPEKQTLNVKLMFTASGSYAPLAEAAVQLELDETENMPDYRFHDEDGAYERQDDAAVYDSALGEFEALMAAAKNAASNDERFVLEAQAEAHLLDSAVMQPCFTQGGNYAVSRVAPYTVPLVQCGYDSSRYFGMVISDELLTRSERDELQELWKKAVRGEDVYDPAAYLTGKGHSLLDTYKLTFTELNTLDWVNTRLGTDAGILANFVDGLVQFDNFNQLKPALAESWELSADGLSYTFHIRHGVKWYTCEGEEYAELTAHDFVAGFRHMLDVDSGISWMVDGVVKGVNEYIYNSHDFSEVGCEAVDDYTLKFTLEAPVPYFMSMLNYNLFWPICKSFYEAQGGAYGPEYAAASDYRFGVADDPSTQVYCGPFRPQSVQSRSAIDAVKNAGYYRANEVTLNGIRWIYDDGSDPTAIYNAVLNGDLSAVSLSYSNGLLEMAKEDGVFDRYAYITGTTSVTYFAGLNLDRGTFALSSGACASPKAEQQRIDTVTAMQNKNFRQALQFAWDKQAYNAVSRGEELAEASLRNMYTPPQLVSLSADTTDANGHSFPAGSFYGELVQYYLEQLGSPITVDDACSGWYDPELARARLEAAKEELGGLVSFPILIDVVYNGSSGLNTAQAESYKQTVEAALGTENVLVNLIKAENAEDFYACGYRAANGAAGNFDMSYGSGWGADFCDPCTFLDTFLSGGSGYMTKTIGLF